MNEGCPHRCIFCNQRISAGDVPQKLTKEMLDRDVNTFLRCNRDEARRVEIAFYGGSFTGADATYQEQLLSWAYPYVQQGLVDAIRISTRPDDVTDEILPLLKHYRVETVELGAQSFVDEVLKQAQRGHRAADTEKAVLILRENGLKIGLHLMVGLPLDTEEGFSYSLDKTIQLKPDAVRIHPVLVLRETQLAQMFWRGDYQPLDLYPAVDLCRKAWVKMAEADIPVIRMGVHLTPEMAENDNVVAGPMHPSLGSLVLSSVFLDYAIKLLRQISFQATELKFILSHRDVSSFCGHRRMNLAAIKALYPFSNLVIESSRDQKRGEIVLSADAGAVYRIKVPGMH